MPADVAAVLGIQGNDLMAVCTASVIKRWAKFKPVRSDLASLQAAGCNQVHTAPQMDETTHEWDTSLNYQWWRDTLNALGLANAYGIYPQTATSLAALFTKYSNSMDWVYDGPNGNVLYPYRLQDFLQYDHDSEEPLGMITAPSSLVLTNAASGGWSIDVAMLHNQDDDANVNTRLYVTPVDVLSALWQTTVYFGFALIDSQGTAKIWVTGTRYYGSGTNGNRLTAGETYTVMPFYCDKALPQDESSGNLNPGPSPIGTARFATIPNVVCPKLTIASSAVTTVDARFTVKAVLQNGKVSVTAVVNAEPLTQTGGTITFHGGTYQQIKIYVCQPGTVPPGSGAPSSTDIITQATYYSAQNPLIVQSGHKATVGGSTQVFNVGASVTKCRVYVYASYGSGSTLYPRVSGDAAVAEDGDIIVDPIQ